MDHEWTKFAYSIACSSHRAMFTSSRRIGPAFKLISAVLMEDEKLRKTARHPWEGRRQTTCVA